MKNNWYLVTSTLLTILWSGCAEVQDSSGSTPPEDVATIDQAARGAMLVDSSLDDLYLGFRGAGSCSGGIIAQDAVLTAYHCLPEDVLTRARQIGGPVDVGVKAARKIGPGVFQCLFSPGNTAATADEACPTYVTARAYWPTETVRPPSEADPRWDVTLLRFLWSNHSGRTVDVTNLPYGGNLQSFGTISYDGEGGGELRYSNYAYVSDQGDYFQADARNGGYQVCEGDSGGNIYTDWGVSAVVSAGLVKYGRKCADALERFTKVGTKINWIESVLGRACPGASMRNCGKDLQPFWLQDTTGSLCLTADGNTAILAACDGADRAQQWVQQSAPDGHTYFYNRGDGKCLAYLTGGYAAMTDCVLNPPGSTGWFVTPEGFARNEFTSACLKVGSDGLIAGGSCVAGEALTWSSTAVVRRPSLLSQQFAIFAQQRVALNDRATIRELNLAPGAVGSGDTINVGVEAQTGFLQAQSAVTVRERAIVKGDINAPAVIWGAGVTFTGVHDPTLREAPAELSLSVNFASKPFCSPSHQTVEQNQTVTPRTDCLYASMMVRQNGRLLFGPGRHYFASLTLDSGALVQQEVGGAGSESRVYVRDSLIWRATATTRAADFLVYYSGNQMVSIGGLFVGTMITPDAEIIIDTPNVSQYGSFLGKIVTLHQGQWVRHIAYGHDLF